MTRNDQPLVEENSDHAPGVSEKRRRLLKASAAVAPLVGTLRSGAALANTSSYQCLANDEKNTPNAQIADFPGHGSGWIEIEGKLSTYTATFTWTGDPPTPTTPVRTATAYVFEGRYFATDPGDPADFLDGSQEFTWPPTVTPPVDSGWSLTGWTETTTSIKYALKYFEPDPDYMGVLQGPILVIVPNPGGTSWTALTGSCWTSLA